MLIPVFVLILLVSCNSDHQTVMAPVKEAIRVTTATVKKERVVTSLRYSGTIEAYQTIPLTFSTTGTVEKVLVEAGDVVSKGQLLASVDPTDARNMLNITQAQYEQAKDAYDRLKSVHEKGSLPDIKWAEIESKLEQARSSRDLAKNNLEKCNLYAPVNGMVGRRNIEPGMSAISLTSAPIELVDIRQVYARISVPENEIALIKKGLKAQFTVTPLGDRTFQGQVMVVSPVADMISRTYEARILVANPVYDLKPGMVADVVMTSEAEREMLLVPLQSVMSDKEGKPSVFLVGQDGKHVERKQIVAGQYHGSLLEVISGLTEGQVIVETGKEKLSDNAEIAY
jgi:RND family efflux transporter MFP subunit